MTDPITDQMWTEAQLVDAHRRGDHESIRQAHRDGRLRDLQAARAAADPNPTRRRAGEALTAAPRPPRPAGQLTRKELARMTPEQVVAAKAAGQLDWLLGIER